jgi:hypothetical protein
MSRKRIILAIVALLPIAVGSVWFFQGVIGLFEGNGFGFFVAAYGGFAIMGGVVLLSIARILE